MEANTESPLTENTQSPPPPPSSPPPPPQKEEESGSTPQLEKQPTPPQENTDHQQLPPQEAGEVFESTPEGSDKDASQSVINNNLYINQLPLDYTETHLKTMFSAYGNVTSAKVMLDLRTNLSRGYGFVKFQTAEEAEKAIQGLNGKQLPNGLSLVVKLATNDGTPNPITAARIASPQPMGLGTRSPNIYVKGIPEHLDELQLREFFGAYGNILDQKILRDHYTGISMGKVLIRYEVEAAADYAIQALQGYSFPGHPIPVTVRYADTPEEKMRRPRPNFGANPSWQYKGHPGAVPYAQPYGGQYSGYSNPYQPSGSGFHGPPQPGQIFVRGLPASTDDAYLFRLFGPYGPVQDVKVVRDPATQMCKGFGFVHMGTPQSATAAMTALNGFVIEGRALQIVWKK